MGYSYFSGGIRKAQSPEEEVEYMGENKERFTEDFFTLGNLM